MAKGYEGLGTLARDDHLGSLLSLASINRLSQLAFMVA